MIATTYDLPGHDVHEILNRHRIAYAAAITWHPKPNETITVASKYYPNAAAADSVVHREALRLGWTKPLWWQWWRWKERVREIKLPVDTPSNDS